MALSRKYSQSLQGNVSKGGTFFATRDDTEAKMTAHVQVEPAALPHRRLPVAGVFAAAITVLIWSLWIVTTRQAASIHLSPVWLGLIRFAVPAVALAPFWWRIGLLPRGVDVRLVAAMVAGAGAPFFIIVAIGMRFAGAAESGVLLGGTMPLFAALLSAAVDRERFGASRLFGFALVIAAMAAIGGAALVQGQGAGRFLVVAGAMLWAVYTLAFRRSGLPALAAAGIIAVWSTLILLPFALIDGFASIRSVAPEILIGQILSQGVLSGIVALACYGAVVRSLGTSRAALLAALPPALAALIAIPALGEIPSPLAILGVVLAVVGVALGSGAVRFGPR